MPQTPRPLDWHQSSLCGTNACVEVAKDFDAVYLRDAKHPGGPHLTISPGAWQAFIRTVKTGRYDVQSPAR